MSKCVKCLTAKSSFTALRATVAVYVFYMIAFVFESEYCGNNKFLKYLLTSE